MYWRSWNYKKALRLGSLTSLALCCYATVMFFLFGALFYFKFSVSRILSWYKYLYRQLKEFSDEILSIFGKSLYKKN